MQPNFSRFANSTFQEQRAQIDAVLQQHSHLPALLAACGALADAEPLSYALAHLTRAGLLRQGTPLQDALRELLPKLADANIAKTLRALERSPEVMQDPSAIQAVIEAASYSLQQLPLFRVAAICFMDRWLKNLSPATREANCARAEEVLRRAIEEDKRDAETKLLLLVPSPRLQALSQRAKELSRSWWGPLVEGFSQQVLSILEAAPKSLSQANAEEILSRRVYTDVGHFFVELLQNAEDAQASQWRVMLQDDAVSLWHDGIPFDAKDVVGVLSIGQTTKKKGQIGFFGVGFKSVYEISDRPQLYSGSYLFEIADVSLPKRLAERPAASPTEGTLLVLPLRDPSDPQRSAAKLYQKALQVPPQTLLTLTSLRELSVSYGERSRSIQKSNTREEGRLSEVVLSQKETGQREAFLVCSERFAFEESRESNRVTETPVLIAVLLDAEGLPAALPAEAPTLFSYLPTKEQSGLRFLLHAHFDLPVDRERLDLTSPWNLWALSLAGDLLWTMLSSLSARGEWARLRAMLSILPLPEDATHPAFQTIATRLRQRCLESALPLLPSATGDYITPGTAYLLEAPSLLSLLAGLSLDDTGRVAAAALTPREEKLALYLGAARFGTNELVAFLSSALSTASGTAAPSWLNSQEKLAALLEVLGQEVSQPGALSARALLPGDGVEQPLLFCAAEIFRASGALRQIYGGTLSFLAEPLDASPSFWQEKLLRALGVVTLNEDHLLRDLQDTLRSKQLTKARSQLWSYLSQVPISKTSALAALALFEAEDGSLLPLQGEAAAIVYLPPDEALTAWLVSLSGARPKLLHDSLREVYPFFSRLGARVLDLESILALIQNESLQITTTEAKSLHLIIEDLQEDLSPKRCEALSRAPIFPSRARELGRLIGAPRVYLAEDEEVAALAPALSWLDDEVAARSYLRLLQAPRVGPDAVAATLLFEDELFDPLESEALRRAYRYLAPRAQNLSTKRREQLLNAPIWLSQNGVQAQLSVLRQAPTSPGLTALYSRWRADAFIHEDALRLALSLRIKIVQVNAETLLDDLCAAAPDMTGELRPLVLAALHEAAALLPRSALLSLKQARIFGAQQTLGSWSAPYAGGCLRVPEELRPIFVHCQYPILSREDERDFAVVLEILAERSANLLDLIPLLEHELTARPEAWSRETRAEIRAAMIRDKTALTPIKNKISALSLWPTRDGNFLGASMIVRASELRRIVGDDSFAEGSLLLSNDAEEDAEALQSLVSFVAPLELVTRKIQAEAKPNETLSAQPPFLATAPQLVRLLALLSRKLEPAALLALPLWVDHEQRLQRGPRLSATREERALLAATELTSELADESWLSALRAQALTADWQERLAPSLSARRILLVLAELSRQPIPASEHSIFSIYEKRQALYQWLLHKASEIEGDPQAHGILGRACVILAPSKTLRAPREFVFMQEPEGLALDWSADEEVPAALVQWLKKAYRLEEQRLGQLVQKLLDAHEEAITRRELHRSAPLLRALANALQASDPTQLAQLAERFRIAKTLRIESETGEITKPKKLFAASKERWSMLSAFLQDPPERLATQYQEDAIIALLKAVGAKTDLDEDNLKLLLQHNIGMKEGLDALLAFARYLGVLLSEDATLRQRLSLEKTAWLPDGVGQKREPRSLYWPTPELRAILGDDPKLFAHPEFFLTVPEVLQQALSFKTVTDANPEDVARRLATLSSAPLEILRWMQQALQDRKIDAAWVRAIFKEQALLLDERGQARLPGELLREPAQDLFGPRRAVWPEAQKLPRLADALGIPGSIGKREVLLFLEEIAAEISPTLLTSEPSLRVNLPACLSFLAKAQNVEIKAAIPVLVEDASGVQSVCLSSEARLRIPEPEALLEKARRERAPYLFVLLPEEAREESIQLLSRLGIADLDSRAANTPPKKQEPEEEKKGLFAKLRHMLTKKDEPEAAPPPVPEEDDPPALQPRHRPPNTPQKNNAQDSQPTPQQDWLRPRAAIGEQLRGAPNWVESRARPPAYGFAFAPKDLPPPYRYAPMLIADRFETRGQRWMRDSILMTWQEPAREAETRVVFRGKIPAGESILPIPLYGRLLQIEAKQEVRQLLTRDGQPLVRSTQDTNLSYEVALDTAPEFLEDAPAPSVPALQKKTVPDEDLPAEVHSFLLQLKGAPGLQKALEIRDFIRARYRYDPSYLEDPAVARWLRQLTYHNANVHISALHAGRDAQHLGRGVCYELNALACELMRRAGIPAAVVTGWTLERGSATEPDHMWSVALLESDVGPRWLPIDASTTRDGRPLRVAHRPAGPWKAKAPETSLPKAPRWMENRGPVSQRSNLPAIELFKVAQHLLSISGQTGIDEELLAKRCREILQSPESAKRLLRDLGIEKADPS